MHFYAALTSPLWGGYQLSLCHTADQLASSALAIIGATCMLGASGFYHVLHWKDEEQEALLATLDYCGIFMQVAFSLAPCFVLLMPGQVGWCVVAVLGATAFAGVGLVFSDIPLGRHGLTWIYIAQGAISLAPLCTRAFGAEPILNQLTATEVQLLLAAAVSYLVGSQIYAHAAPRLWPRRSVAAHRSHLVQYTSYLMLRTKLTIARR